MDDDHELGRQRRAQSCEVGGVALESGEGRVGVGLTEERHPAGQALVQHQSERVEVGPAVELLAAHLLGRQVLGGAHHDVVAGQVGFGRLQTLGDAEVGQEDPPVGGHHDVAGLDVAMDEPRSVRVIERGGHAGADVTGEFRTQPLLGVEDLAQALALDQLHHDCLAAVLFEHVVDGDDVGMVEARRGDRFTSESFGDHGVGGQRGLQPFHGDLAVECEVDGEPHLGHAALGEHALEFVAVRDDRRCGWRGRGHDWERTLAVPAAVVGSIREVGPESGPPDHSDVTWNATPIVPRPPWVPMTGPISPTTISPG